MYRHLVRGHTISVLNHCLSGISSLTLTYTTPDIGLTCTCSVVTYNVFFRRRRSVGWTCFRGLKLCRTIE